MLYSLGKPLLMKGCRRNTNRNIRNININNFKVYVANGNTNRNISNNYWLKEVDTFEIATVISKVDG